MKVRTGTPLWKAISPSTIDAPPLADDVRCAVVILGSGITGALVGYYLARAGMDAVLIDKGHPGSGSTAASTGLLQYEVDNHLADLIDQVGEERAVHAYRRGLRAIDEIEQTVDELEIDCGFSRRESIYFASNWFHHRRLRREFQCRRHYGLPVEFLDRAQLANRTSIRASAAIVSTRDAQVDPYRLTMGLLKRGAELGLRLHGNTEVLDIVGDEPRLHLKTKAATITAERIVMATGYESAKHLGYEPGSLHSTYAVASAPLKSFEGWLDGCLIWETARPYFYARQSDDGRAIIGGGDTLFSNDHRRDALVESKAARLVRRFHRLFPAIPFEPEFVWAGTFGESPDGLPFIGRPAGDRQRYFAMCYGGNGITYGMIAARLITDLCRGQPNADEQVFGFER